MEAAEAPIERRRVNLRPLLIVAVLGVAGFGFWLSADQTVTETAPVLKDSAVEGVFPAEGALDVRQAEVGIDLQAGFTAVLIIDGVEIPEDQLERVEAVGQVLYRPAVGKETGAFEPGQHCVVAILWNPTTGTRESSGRPYRWCFTAH